MFDEVKQTPRQCLKCGGQYLYPRWVRCETCAKKESERSSGFSSEVAEAAQRVKALVERSMAAYGADQMGGLERDALTLALAALQATPREVPTEETAIRSLLCRAVLRGWRRGRRNQDPEQEEIADDLLLEAGVASEEKDGRK